MKLDDVEGAWRKLLLAREPVLMAGPDEARQRVYRRLVRGNLSGSMRRGVPILRKLAGEDNVDALITRFLDEVAPKTRLVRYVPLEFGQWLMENAAAIPELPHAAAGELAHWEALEIDVIMAPDAEPASLSRSPTDDARVEMHPSARLAAYRHPVHVMTTASTTWPAASTSQPYILLAWRSAEKLAWQSLEGGVAKVLVETSSGTRIGDAFATVEASLVEGDVLDRARVRAALVDLSRRGAIAGFSPGDGAAGA